MKTGIYKITNPKNKIYIGQTIDFNRRLKEYENLKCKNQIKLFNSLKKYGINNHKFELIEECNFENLNKRERYWQNFYDVIENGLNLVLVGYDNEKKKVSNETKIRIKKSIENYFNDLNIDEKKKIYGKSAKKKKGKIGNRKGCKLSKEHINKIIESRKWYKPTNKTKDKIRKKMIGRKITWKDKIGESNRGKSRNKGNGTKQILQYTIDEKLVKVWDSISKASKITGISFNAISNNLTGRSKISGGFKWKYK